MTTQSAPRPLDRFYANRIRPLIDKALGRKVLKRPTKEHLGRLQSRFAKGPAK